ncbi:hypothetical protein ACFL6I_28375 [candidate division KSB1 bacterium]
MSRRGESSNIFDWLIKLAIILFLLPIFRNVFMTVDVGSNFFDIVLKILIAVVFIGCSIILIVLSKLTYRAFGFFGVLVASFYMLLKNYLEEGIVDILTVYILLIAISLYFLSKNTRPRK